MGLDFLKQVQAEPRFCTMREFEENKDNVVSELLVAPISRTIADKIAVNETS